MFRVQSIERACLLLRASKDVHHAVQRVLPASTSVYGRPLSTSTWMRAERVESSSRHNEQSYVHMAADIKLLGCTLGQLLCDRAACTPNREAFVFLHQKVLLSCILHSILFFVTHSHLSSLWPSTSKFIHISHSFCPVLYSPSMYLFYFFLLFYTFLLHLFQWPLHSCPDLLPLHLPSFLHHGILELVRSWSYGPKWPSKFICNAFFITLMPALTC